MLYSTGGYPQRFCDVRNVPPGPSGPASQSNNARALINFFAPVLPFRVNAKRYSRSGSVKVTRYLGAMATSYLGCHGVYNRFIFYET
jgi:hypothetical protein